MNELDTSPSVDRPRETGVMLKPRSTMFFESLMTRPSTFVPVVPWMVTGALYWCRRISSCGNDVPASWITSPLLAWAVAWSKAATFDAGMVVACAAGPDSARSDAASGRARARGREVRRFMPLASAPPTPVFHPIGGYLTAAPEGLSEDFGRFGRGSRRGRPAAPSWS